MDVTCISSLYTSYHASGNRVEFAYESGQPVKKLLTTYEDRGKLDHMDGWCKYANFNSSFEPHIKSPADLE